MVEFHFRLFVRSLFRCYSFIVVFLSSWLYSLSLHRTRDKCDTFRSLKSYRIHMNYVIHIVFRFSVVYVRMCRLIRSLPYRLHVTIVTDALAFLFFFSFILLIFVYHRSIYRYLSFKRQHMQIKAKDLVVNVEF
jgi:hypothetical protein